MSELFEALVEGLVPANPQTQGSLTIFPLLAPGIIPQATYLSLEAAQAKRIIKIREVSEAGDVPSLIVENRGKVGVLILDGEELAGARQNRVLNTNVLVPPRTNVKVPVNCSEHGRWHYTSQGMESSGHLMPSDLRRRKKDYVRESLEMGAGFEGRQHDVWEDISAYAEGLGARSDTGAMKDALDQFRSRADEMLCGFPPSPGQRGVAVFLDGAFLGLEYLSREEVYRSCHEKVLRSYIATLLGREARERRERWLRRLERRWEMSDSGGRWRDARFERVPSWDEWLRSELGGRQTPRDPSRQETPQDAAPKEIPPAREGAAERPSPDAAFAEVRSRLRHLEARPYPSPGMGVEVRYGGEKESGSGLELETEVICVTVFPAEEDPIAMLRREFAEDRGPSSKETPHEPRPASDPRSASGDGKSTGTRAGVRDSAPR